MGNYVILIYLTLSFAFNPITSHQFKASVEEIPLDNTNEKSCDGVSHQSLSGRVSKIKLNHKNQQENSKILRDFISEDRKEISQLRGRVAQLEDILVNSNIDPSETENPIITERIIKRPARLLPLQVLL